MRPIADVAGDFGLLEDEWLPFGRHKAKVCKPPNVSGEQGRLILVSGITPTKAGEGKTTVSVGLAMALNKLGRRATACIREPSLGPVFGMKGGGTGGGVSQVEPADDINLHFTGDLHAIGSAHNLLAAMVDNQLHFQHSDNASLDSRSVVWPRVIDMNDRALRRIVVGLGGASGGVPRETRFDITAASEVMAIVCLASDEADLRDRIGRIHVGADPTGKPVTASDLGAVDAMVALLRDAMLPNLVQTTEGSPALVHGGPFANIAHGCSSVVATRLSLSHSEYTVTEAGFGFDLGGEKFLDIKCRAAGLWPDAVVLVVTLRALLEHGSGDSQALEKGLANLDHHLDAIAGFDLPTIVALNRFADDSPELFSQVEAHCASRGVDCKRTDAFSTGAEGSLELAESLVTLVEGQSGSKTPRFPYAIEERYDAKLQALAARLYGAKHVSISPGARRAFRALEAQGLHLPVCVAKTPHSISDDPKLRGRPKGHTLHIRDVRLSAGAGFVVALAGDVVTMPGLPADPAARYVHIDAQGAVHGLMRT